VTGATAPALGAPAIGLRASGPALAFGQNPLVAAGTLLALLLLAVAVGARWLAPSDPTAIDPAAALQPPSLATPFGTDRFGRDVLSRTIFGTQVSLLVGLGSIAMAASVGALLGLLSGYLGGAVDELVSRIMDVFFTFPSLILALTISVALGVGAQNALLAIALTYWPSFGRVVRSAAIGERGKEYVQAARLLGASDLRIMLRHLLPNVRSPLVVQTTVAISHAIIIESSLSYLGLGVQPPTPSWGSMINEGRAVLQAAPWVSVFPGLAIMAAVLAFNLLGDGLRDLLDPRAGAS
jgi:peptide/nickel transport system permease protein